NVFNNLTNQLATVGKYQQEILREIRNTSSKVFQGVTTILTEFGSLKHHVNNTACLTDGGPRGSNIRNKLILCDNEWIIIQRRGTPSLPGTERTNFDRIWAVYENGFGTIGGDFWIGLKAIHELTTEGYTQLKVDLEDWNGEKRYAMFDVFEVAGSKDKYRLTVSGYTGIAGD
ncbi:Angiopoietin-4, partial [Folsomia candida]